MEINYLAILGAAVLSMIVGAIWYGPLFGKVWMEIVGVDANDMKAREEMQKGAMPLYIIQLLITIGQLYILAHFIKGWNEVSGIEVALWLWLGFVVPTLAAASMWTTDKTKVKWARFLIQGGYFLVMFIIFGYILGNWG